MGDFVDAGYDAHGYLRASGGTFTTIDVSGAKLTYAHGINAAGQIVGNFMDAGNEFHGFFHRRPLRPGAGKIATRRAPALPRAG